MKYFTVALLSVLFFTLTYESASREFSSYDLIIILILLAVAISIQLLIARLFSRYRALQNLALAGFTLINISSVHLNLNTSFLSLPTYLAAIALLAGLFILFTVFNIIDDIPQARRGIPLIILLSITGVSIYIIYTNRLTNWPTPAQGQTSARNVHLVDFNSKPNVYFIAFDALAPKATLNKYLDINTAPYHAILDANFRRFSNFFADRIRTKQSLNSLLALDIEHFDKTTNQNSRFGFFPGLTPSPLFEIFKHNGYTTNTLHTGVYFGQQPGPYVDHYITAKKVGVCDFIKIRRAYTFLGYCALLDTKYVQTVLARLNIISDLDTGKFILEKMVNGLADGKPQIFVAYMFSPGHVDWLFNYDNLKEVKQYRRQFLRNSAATAKYISNIINFISKRDPEAILYIFGDHGALLSHKLQFPDNSTFVIQDRFGVYGGVYSKNTCIESIPEQQTGSFTTVSQGARMIITCLSNGDDPFSEKRDYHLPYFGKTYPQRYTDYLYE